MSPESSLWLVFGITIVGFLIADLGYFNRQAHRVEPRSALIQSGFWISVAIAFGFLIFLFLGRETAAAYMSAYVTEKMLSVDNLFVMLLIFDYFKLEEKYHHRVLFWGIMGAIVFRALFIGLGAVIVSQFHWVLYIFGVILIYTGIKLLTDKQDEHADFGQNPVLRLAHKFLRITESHHGGKFFVREHGKMFATSLVLVMVLIEFTDIVFAVDSIPAAFSISQDPFVIYTSNVFAIMGLRALFSLVEGILHRFHHLQKGLSFILVFIGAKMLAGIFDLHLSSIISFAIIMGALGASLLASYVFPKKI